MISFAHRDYHGSFVALCGLVGLRASEALAVTPDCFDLSAMKLTVRGKGDVTRIVPVSPEAWDVLAITVTRSFCSRPNNEAPYTPIIGLQDRFARRLVTDLGVRAGLQRRISSHDLRATFATAVYDKTKDMRLVQLLLGHASVNTTQLYVDVAEDKLKSAVVL